MTDAVRKGNEEVRKSMGVFGQLTDSLFKIQTFTNSITHIGESLGQMTEPAVEFQQRMADLSAITAITGEELVRVGEMAR